MPKDLEYKPTPYVPVDETPETADRPGDAFEIAEAKRERERLSKNPDTTH